MSFISGPNIYSDLKKKENLSRWRKFYPWKELLLIPDIILPQNIRAIKRFYVVLRKFDDICDGDDKLWLEVSISVSVINDLVDSVINWSECKHKEPLLLYLYQTYLELYGLWWKKLLEDFRKISILCAETLTYDKTRIDAHKAWNTMYPLEKEIDSYIDNMELRWVLKWLLLLLWWTWEIGEFRDLIHATRKYYYFSRDIEEDVKDWLYNFINTWDKINVMKEKMKKDGASLLTWCTSDTEFLSNITYFQRLVISWLYINPANKYFNSK